MAGAIIKLDTATPRMKRLAGFHQGRGRGDRLLMRWGAVVRKIAIRTAIDKGGKRFWRELARSINLVQGSINVNVEASHVAAAQKQYGGKIRAKGQAAGGSDFLTIPIADEAEGQSAAKFALAGDDLVVITSKAGNAILGRSDDDEEFTPLFVLVRETKEQRPDKFMPSEKEIAHIGEKEAVRMIKE